MAIRIAVDKAQKDGKHDLKHDHLRKLGCELILAPLPVGDYVLADDKVLEVIGRRAEKLSKLSLMGSYTYSIDTKQGMSEVYGNLVGDHKRFRDECVLAKQNGIQLTVLIESGPEVMSMEDVEKWRYRKREIIFERTIRRKYQIPKETDFQEALADLRSHGIRIQPPVRGEQLSKTMRTMTEKYGVAWAFCNPKDTGWNIYELLQRHNTMILDEDIDMLKQAVPMRRLAEYHGIKVNSAGFCRCPFHSEKTGSMKIYPGSGGWHCFGACQTGGDIISFEMKFSGLTFEDACRNIADMFGIQLQDKRLSGDDLAKIRKKQQEQQERRQQEEERVRLLKAEYDQATWRLKFLQELSESARPFSMMQAYALKEIPVLEGKCDSLYGQIFGKEQN